MNSRFHDSGPNPWRATLSGLCALLVGIGLGRFAYTPLIPALIAADWFTPSQAMYLGAANLAGYLAGALLAPRMAARATAQVALRSMMLMATAAFFACAFPISLSWYFAWRCAAGISGGVLMALAAPTVLSIVPASRQGLAGGLIFTGVGLGIAASGTLIPLLLRAGLAATWHALGVLALGLTLTAWRGWSTDTMRAVAPRVRQNSRQPPRTPELLALNLGYALIAAGLTPHMVFLVDFISRGLGHGLAVGGAYWVLFGFGAIAGPVIAGKIADRIGFALTLRLAIVTLAASVGWLALSPGDAGLFVSSIFVGAAVPGVVPLMLGRVHELTSQAVRVQAWSIATAAFALGQAGAAYGMAFLFERTGGHTPIFALGAAMFLTAMTIDLRVSSLLTRAAPGTEGG